jgi:hypothetical protein
MPDFSRPNPAAAESQIVEAPAESLAAEPVAMSVETATVAPDEMLDAADPSEAYEVLAAAGHDPEPLAVAAAPAVMANSAAPVVASPIVSAPPTAGTPEPASPASLGAAVLAHGVLRKPILNSDPLAALRRMTQAEKLAFFS